MITLRIPRSVHSFCTVFGPLLVWVFAWSVSALGQATAAKSATAEDIKAFFKGKQKTVLTFVGYSGAGYEDEVAMRKEAERVLGEYDPAKTIVNIGATPEGIGAVYELAKRKGFLTTGIVSSQA